MEKMRNRFWPAYYILGKNGRDRDVHDGETQGSDVHTKKSTNAEK